MKLSNEQLSNNYEIRVCLEWDGKLRISGKQYESVKLCYD